MAEEQQEDNSGEIPKLLAQLVDALEQQTMEQGLRHEQQMELYRRSFDLSEKTNLLYQRAVEQQATSARLHQDRLVRTDQQQKRAQQWSAALLILFAAVLLVAFLLPHHVK